MRRGDRVAILALNHPDYLALLYACARLGAMLVPLNWRLAVPEQLFILADASVKALFVAGRFDAWCRRCAQRCPSAHHRPGLRDRHGDAFERLLAAGRGDGRNPHVDLARPLLIVYTLGHHRPAERRGAERRRRCCGTRVMSQHMHAHDGGRSRADGAAAVPCRRAEHPDHAGAAARRDGHAACALHAG